PADLQPVGNTRFAIRFFLVCALPCHSSSRRLGGLVATAKWRPATTEGGSDESSHATEGRLQPQHAALGPLQELTTYRPYCCEIGSSHMWCEIIQSPLGCFLRTLRNVPLLDDDAGLPF